jgi:hypothetical protein
MNEVKILAIDNNADNLVGLNALLTAVLPEVIFIRALSGKEGIEFCLIL